MRSPNVSAAAAGGCGFGPAIDRWNRKLGTLVVGTDHAAGGKASDCAEQGNPSRSHVNRLLARWARPARPLRVLPAAAESLDEGEVARNDEHAQPGGDQHAPEHARAHHVLRARACAARQHHRHNAQDEGEGRHQDRPEAQAGRLQRRLLERRAPFVLCLGEFDDQDRVLGRQPDQHHEADLHVDVVVEAHQPYAEEGTQGHQRRPHEDRPGQAPALVERGQQQEHADDGQDEGRRGRWRHLLLVRHRRVGEAHLLGHRLREHLLQRRERLSGGVATRRRALDFDGTLQVEPGRQFAPGDFRDGDERGQRNHHVGGLRANVDLADVLRIEPCLRVRLRIDAVEPPEAVEVVGVRAPQRRRQRLEHVVHRDAQRARLLAVQLDLDLRVVRIERGEQRAELRPFPCFGDEFPRLAAELVDGQGAAAVLQQEIEPGCGAEPGQGWNVEREDDRLGNGRELPLQPAHDALHMQGFALALLPRLEPHEDGAVVRLIGAGDRTIAANGLKGFDAVGLRKNVLDSSSAARWSARATRRAGAGR